jgi:hypothetical protein
MWVIQLYTHKHAETVPYYRWQIEEATHKQQHNASAAQPFEAFLQAVAKQLPAAASTTTNCHPTT